MNTNTAIASSARVDEYGFTHIGEFVVIPGYATEFTRIGGVDVPVNQNFGAWRKNTGATSPSPERTFGTEQLAHEYARLMSMRFLIECETELAFEPLPGDEVAAVRTLLRLRAAGHVVRLFDHSHTGYGDNGHELTEQELAQLILFVMKF